MAEREIRIKLSPGELNMLQCMLMLIEMSRDVCHPEEADLACRFFDEVAERLQVLMDDVDRLRAA